ncbi:hypothetical protein RA280_32445 [Cupriavidus sp. CV2]|uniref:hypothetical protein n=1 Tax=Cupriavidus ulmosensis TaxID=3065913 RepID=UPI00296B566D|nr:hypothetical protein [Cupriavidus sp. CV2]MDW3686369.1 hypothetical protein [Cupriavidus sp. CV2]
MSKKATDQLVVGMDIGYGNIKMDWGDGDLAYPARVKPDWFGATESHKLNGMRASYDEVKVLVNSRYYWIDPDTHLWIASSRMSGLPTNILAGALTHQNCNPC